MKKQLLILTMISVMLSINQAMSQPSLVPTRLECVDLDDPLRVVSGHEYTYTVEVPAPDGTKTYHWFVTQETHFMSLNTDDVPTLTTIRENFGGSILAGGSDWYDEPTDPGSGPTINLTWQSFTLDPDEYVFVVIYVENQATDGCLTNNLKVYRIQPLHAFTIDIANVDLLNPEILPGEDFESCISDVQSAYFDIDAGGVVYDFGQNVFYYVVAAANFTGDYELSIRFDGDPLRDATLDGTLGQVATLYHGSDWAAVLAAGGDGLDLANDNTVSFVVNGPATGSVGPDGLMHYIKIVIDHNRFEAADLTEYLYTVQIDGILVNDLGAPLGDHDDFGDMVDLGEELPCDYGYVPFIKETTQILTPRPQINSVGPDFEPIVEP